MLRMRGEIDRGLTRRIAAAHDDDGARGGERRVDRRGPVVDTFAFELAQVIEIETAITRARCNHDRGGANARVVVERDLEAARRGWHLCYAQILRLHFVALDAAFEC